VEAPPEVSVSHPNNTGSTLQLQVTSDQNTFPVGVKGKLDFA